jgi:hypothetical protein
MKEIHLSSEWAEFLMDKPETGMGYQRVDIVFEDGRILRNAIVLNANLLSVPEDYGDAKVIEIRMSAPGGNSSRSRTSAA